MGRSATQRKARAITGDTTAPVVAERIPSHGVGRLAPLWQKGQSGNPTGVIDFNAYNEARAICAQASPEAARKQVALMSSEDERVALMATEAVLNRGVGKPRDHTDDKTQRVSLAALKPDELATLATLLKRALGIE